ncbi:hypothetical protein Golax_018634, partial [Gossypium laxum]|nr:hypothetical protein [Gossypium laxum]
IHKQLKRRCTGGHSWTLARCRLFIRDSYTRGIKLDPLFINALVKRWRPEMHTFHLPYGECTFTLDNVSLQLSLPVDGNVITGPIVSAGWSATCEQLLGKTIEASTSDVEKEQSARAFILRLMEDLLMPDKFRNFVHLKWLLQLVNLREVGRLSWRSAHRYDYLPTCEPYLTSELATSSNYTDWFKHYGKLCLLPTLERSKKYLRKRPIRGPINPRSRGHVADRLTFAPHAHPDPVPVQPP